MAAPPPVIALPWYARGNYLALLKLFSDPDKWPATYDGWLKPAELTEKQFQKAGIGVARIWIRPRPFAGLVQGAERCSGPVGAPDFRK
jgi:hypothetical protein